MNYIDKSISDQELFDKKGTVDKKHHLKLCKAATNKNSYNIGGIYKKRTLKIILSQDQKIYFFNDYSEKARNQTTLPYYHYTRCVINNNLLMLISIHNLPQERNDYKQIINQSLRILP